MTRIDPKFNDILAVMNADNDGCFSLFKMPWSPLRKKAYHNKNLCKKANKKRREQK